MTSCSKNSIKFLLSQQIRCDVIGLAQTCRWSFNRDIGMRLKTIQRTAGKALAWLGLRMNSLAWLGLTMNSLTWLGLGNSLAWLGFDNEFTHLVMFDNKIIRLVRYGKFIRLVRFRKFTRLVRFGKLTRLVRFGKFTRLVRFGKFTRLVRFGGIHSLGILLLPPLFTAFPSFCVPICDYILLSSKNQQQIRH